MLVSGLCFSMFQRQGAAPTTGRSMKLGHVSSLAWRSPDQGLAFPHRLIQTLTWYFQWMVLKLSPRRKGIFGIKIYEAPLDWLRRS